MNRNTESHFSLTPHVDISRSRFDRSCSIKTSFDVGEVIPFFVDEVLPGDTFSVDTSKVVRMQTLLTPIMDNVYLDTYYFFVPNRLVWEHWKQFCGENTESAWIPQTEYAVPRCRAPQGGWQVGTIADYMGIPTGVSDVYNNVLPFRAYALIMNEWFRDQNLQDPLAIPMDDSIIWGSNGSNFIQDCAKGGKPFIAAKYHDYFTSCLPSPQKGPDVLIPAATSGQYPVYAMADSVPSFAQYSSGLKYGVTTAGTTVPTVGITPSMSPSDGTVGAIGESQVSGGSIGTGTAGWTLAPANLWAMSSGGIGASINQLRLAFQIQKYYEQLARGGSRYTEVVRSFFGVVSPDSRLQRPEYLGGNRVPITVNQIVQQSGTESTGTPQGTVVGQSLTTDSHSDFTKSFTEHGFVIGLMVARYDHTYQQGLNRMWSRRSKFDYYWPVFANIGEQPVKNKEIFAQGGDYNEDVVDNEVFGYQEAWADYRYKPNQVTGQMRSAYKQSLDVWHLADDYDKLPSLSDSWIREDKVNVDRVLAVTSSVSNQLFADIYVKNLVTRPMPMYSIPGLIDHH